jgi:hypothetical protein
MFDGVGYVAPNGSSLFYESWGERGETTPVLLCDGIVWDGYVWRHLRQNVAERRPHYCEHRRGCHRATRHA